MSAGIPSSQASQSNVEHLLSLAAVDGTCGLAAADAEQRRARHGPNAFDVQRPRSAWLNFLDQFRDPLVYLLLIAACVTLVAWWVEAEGGLPVDGIVILSIVALNAVLGFLQEAKSQRAAAALARLASATSGVLRSGTVLRIPSTELVSGDILLLAEGDRVGADARLIDAHALLVQQASLTGESEAVQKQAGELSGEHPLADRHNMVFKGTEVVRGNGRALVTAIGMQTEMGAIAHLLATTPDEATPLQKEVRHIGRVLGGAVLVIATIVILTELWTADIRTWTEAVPVLLLGVSLAVAAVPEGLPAILSLVLALGVQRMAAQKAIVKKLSSVETLGSASVICTDKTGTLTRSEMTIQRVMTASGSSSADGVGYAPEGRMHHKGETLQPGALHSEVVALLSGGSLAGNADLRQDADGNWVIQGDPTEAAFLVAERKLDAHERRLQRFDRIAEVPFTSERKMMSVVAIDHAHADQLVLISKGAPDVLLDHCTRARVGMDAVPLTADARARVLADVEQLSHAALRTLSVAYRPLEAGEDAQAGEALEQDLVFLGTVGIIDPPRTEVAPAIEAARAAGIRIILITGDHPRTAERIAEDLGIIQAGATGLTGLDIDRLDDAALGDAVRTASVFARVAPAHKLRIVDALQAQGHVVAMTGDGVNDAPALKSADIGVAMGVTGTEVTKEASKMILADDNFATIIAAVREGRGILDNIRKFLRYLLSSNMGEVLTVFLGIVLARSLGLVDAAGAVVLPLFATQILWINLITDTGPALAMGVDPHADDVMTRPPRPPNERVIDARMWVTVGVTGITMAVVTLLTLDLLLPGGWIEGEHGLDVARTAAFTVLVLAQLFNAFNARSDTTSAFVGVLSNRWLWAAVLLGATLQILVVHWPVLNLAFSTTPLSAGQWLLCLCMASAVLWVSELHKFFRRRPSQRRAVAAT
ncbi:cation-translocating P-type ATPase [Hydrogenophaga sp. BPS33]|uniref:cation-translocating P-type ATPase n=1 Tax=Hydrogenophaga sp. BPS33 TaxID=2651974 RepID=UPI00131F7CBC|nr:cation-translocating P-type ATPase [Hydrogenophaga sp. BPS33]QHE86244.1 cation-translocating P-type ATPase [Hydrogenophaga sp. BPS33]